MKNYYKVIKEYGIRAITDKLLRIFRPLIIHYRWNKEIKRENFQGTCNYERSSKIIVSLTSFPARINRVEETIKSLMLQSCKPDKIILWLAEEEFPRREQELPSNLLLLQKYGLTIGWTQKNIRSFKKLIPCLVEYPEDVIVTVDDDIYYQKKWLEILYRGYLKNTDAINCYRAYEYVLLNEKYGLKRLDNKKKIKENPSYLYNFTGAGGVLYPPHVLHTDVFKEDIFMNYCSTSDDLWFLFMALRNHTKINIVEKFSSDLVNVPNTQDIALHKLNNEQGKYWECFNNLIELYPEINKLLRKEIRRIEGIRYKRI